MSSFLLAEIKWSREERALGWTDPYWHHWQNRFQFMGLRKRQRKTVYIWKGISLFGCEKRTPNEGGGDTMSEPLFKQFEISDLKPNITWAIGRTVYLFILKGIFSAIKEQFSKNLFLVSQYSFYALLYLFKEIHTTSEIFFSNSVPTCSVSAY